MQGFEFTTTLAELGTTVVLAALVAVLLELFAFVAFAALKAAFISSFNRFVA